MQLQHLSKKRLILIDLDGTTLMSNGEQMHPKTKEALIMASNEGHHVCIITGRPTRASIRFYNELRLNTLLTNFDGAHIHYPYSKKFKRIVFSISEEIVKEIMNHEKIKKIITNVLVESYNRAMIKEKDEFVENFFHLDDVVNDEYKIMDPYKYWEGAATNLVLFVNNEDEKDEILRVLEKFRNSIKIQLGNVYGNLTKSNKMMISITNKIVNKGVVANILAQYYNKDIRDVIAFGDAMNDHEMIKNVGYGVAMKNGCEELKSIASGITTATNNQGGLGDYLEKLLRGFEV